MALHARAWRAVIAAALLAVAAAWCLAGEREPNSRRRRTDDAFDISAKALHLFLSLALPSLSLFRCPLLPASSVKWHHAYAILTSAVKLTPKLIPLVHQYNKKRKTGVVQGLEAPSPSPSPSSSPPPEETASVNSGPTIWEALSGPAEAAPPPAPGPAAGTRIGSIICNSDVVDVWKQQVGEVERGVAEDVEGRRRREGSRDRSNSALPVVVVVVVSPAFLQISKTKNSLCSSTPPHPL
jgi:hypothetical protein